MFFQPLSNVVTDPPGPALAYRHFLDNNRIIWSEAAPQVRPDLLGAPGRVDEPDRGEGVNAILEDFETGKQGGLTVFVVEFVADEVAGHG